MGEETRTEENIRRGGTAGSKAYAVRTWRVRGAERGPVGLECRGWGWVEVGDGTPLFKQKNLEKLFICLVLRIH